MIGEVQGARLLAGARGRPAGDVDALVDAIMGLERLAMDLAGDVAELDVNPLVVRHDGVVALDAVIVPSDPDGASGT